MRSPVEGSGHCLQGSFAVRIGAKYRTPYGLAQELIFLVQREISGYIGQMRSFPVPTWLDFLVRLCSYWPR
jgi:hypothetical protein